MTLRRLLVDLYERGISYHVGEGGRLRYSAPNGLTDELRTAMREHKTDLLFIADGTPIYGKGCAPWERV
jgi:hypothetical protein